jgi:NADH-quinone oxidoreductase subunit G
MIFKDLSNLMKKPLDFKNIKELRSLINKKIQSNISKEINQINKVNFVNEDISIKSIDYYYTNPIARSSKVMSECRQISKKFLSTGIEKAS